jgi:two-component system, OmpR family, phosphate regulon response regulator PhoB
MKLLLADDDAMLTQLFSTQLRAKGVDVVVAHDAMQAFMTALRTQPDVIVLDVQMPGGTGLSALRKLKTSAKTSAIPVLVLSGSVEPEASETVKQLGAAQFMLKPVEPDALYQALTALVNPPK